MQPIVDKLRRTVRLAIKNDAIIKCAIADEKMSDADIAENILVIYNAIVNVLPQKENNVKNLLIKMTMGSPVKIGDSNDSKAQSPCV